MLSTTTRPMPVFIITNDDVAAAAHDIASSLRRDIDSCCHGLFGHNKRHVEMYILPEGYVLNVVQQRRKQCAFTQLRPELFDETFLLEDVLFEVVDNIVDSSQLDYTRVLVEQFMADVYLERATTTATNSARSFESSSKDDSPHTASIMKKGILRARIFLVSNQNASPQRWCRLARVSYK